MEKKEQLYEGKAKQVFATDDPNLIIMHYKDDATAYNGIKKAQIFSLPYTGSMYSILISTRSLAK